MGIWLALDSLDLLLSRYGWPTYSPHARRIVIVLIFFFFDRKKHQNRLSWGQAGLELEAKLTYFQRGFIKACFVILLPDITGVL